jgi:hypothetical protein
VCFGHSIHRARSQRAESTDLFAPVLCLTQSLVDSHPVMTKERCRCDSSMLFRDGHFRESEGHGTQHELLDLHGNRQLATCCSATLAMLPRSTRQNHLPTTSVTAVARSDDGYKCGSTSLFPVQPRPAQSIHVAWAVLRGWPWTHRSLPARTAHRLRGSVVMALPRGIQISTSPRPSYPCCNSASF